MNRFLPGLVLLLLETTLCAGDRFPPKLERILVLRMEAREAKLGETLEFLRRKTNGIPPFRYIPENLSERMVSLAVSNASLSELIEYVAAIAHVQVEFTAEGPTVTNDRRTRNRSGQPSTANSLPGKGVCSKKPGISWAWPSNFVRPISRTALGYLARKSVEIDTAEPNPANRGVNLIVIPPVTPFGRPPPDPRVTVSLSETDFLEALREVTSLFGAQLRVADSAFVVDFSR